MSAWNKITMVLLLGALCGNCINNNGNRVDKLIVPAQNNFVSRIESDIPIDSLLTELRRKYSVPKVRLSSAFLQSDGLNTARWIKLELTNPEIVDEKFDEVTQGLARGIFSHIKNAQEFEKIEIKVLKKTGFILTLNSSRTVYYYRDSL